MEDKTSYTMEPAASKHPYGVKVIEYKISCTPEPLAELEQLRHQAEVYETALLKIIDGQYTWTMREIAREALGQAGVVNK